MNTTVEQSISDKKKINFVSNNTYAMCEMFFSRITLCDLDWGVIVRSLKDIEDNIFENWDHWFKGWQKVASEFEQSGDHALDEKLFETAADNYLRAAACNHFSEFMYVQNPNAKNEARKRVTKLFEQAIPYLAESVERIIVPFKDMKLPGYFMRAHGEKPGPIVILVNGLESAKEVELYAFAKGYLRRGISVLLFDGPGQGVFIGHKPMILNFENVIESVLNYLYTISEVDRNRIGIFGVSFGGLLAMRGASTFPEQIKACVNLSGGFDYDNFATMPPIVKNGFRYVFFEDDPNQMEVISKKHLNLRDMPPISKPLLCIHGEQDKIALYESCQRIMEWASGKKQLISYAHEHHVCTSYFQDFLPKAYDWLKIHL